MIVTANHKVYLSSLPPSLPPLPPSFPPSPPPPPPPASSPLDSLSDMSDFSDEEMNIPKVVLNKQLPRKEPPLSPIMKKIRRKKGGSPPKSMSNGGTPSPSFSPGASPRTSPRTSPVPVVRGVKKYLKKVSVVVIAIIAGDSLIAGNLSGFWLSERLGYG